MMITFVMLLGFILVFCLQRQLMPIVFYELKGHERRVASHDVCDEQN